MLIICYYIVVRYLGYGASLLDCLVFVGFNLRGLSIFWPVGGIGFLGGGGGSIIQIFGIWSDIV